jgi:ABC-type molybdenum transport system ATPase subunit/photorepair protein PhrA
LGFKDGLFMSFDIRVPQATKEEYFSHELELGNCLFVLGANGSGKSSLMHYVYKEHRDNALRLAAHRRTWLESGAVDLSPHQKQRQEHRLQSMDSNDEARWKDDSPEIRPSIAIFNLIDAENLRARKIAEAVDNNKIEYATSLSSYASPISSINEILRLSNMPIEITVQKGQEVMASRYGGEAYSAAKLSDGERNALLIAASILTAEPNSLILIDEPERHLHHSISSPLLGQIFASRPDCAFLVSSHEVMLPLDHETASIMLVRNCRYDQNNNLAWDLDLVTGGSDDIDESIKADIFGQRRDLLFIEGNTDRSLDKPLYSLLFPNISVITKTSCNEVERSVYGIRAAEQLHWLRAYGIVDNDARNQEDLDRLRRTGIYALDMYSVESIYYDPQVQHYVANKHAQVTGEEPEQLLSAAKHEALSSVSPHIRRLAARRAEKRVRQQIFSNLPTSRSVSDGEPVSIDIDVASELDIEYKKAEKAIEDADLMTLIRRYPLRETPALDKIAKALGFRDRKQYESAVLTELYNNKQAREYVYSLVGDLSSNING